MSALTLGVIGHVDHGKTALVRALTGIETDRLAEEKRRGVSIVLGFAPLATPRGTIDFIDMPGHERFIRAMVSGATGISAVLLVVAADEGVKPQTLEHLEIARLLGIRTGVVALTKADLVTPAECRTRRTEVRRLARQAGLADAPLVTTSVRTSQGLSELRAALDGLLANARPPRDDGFAYLPIDRVFARPGFGPVVTGTLRRGPLAIGDELILLPASRPVRVRSLQSHGEDRSVAEPGGRTAVSLRGIELSDLHRGMALSSPGLLVPARWLDVVLETARNASRPVTNGDRLKLLIGTTESTVRVRLLEGQQLEPGQSCLAQLRTDGDVAVPARERFILRRDSPSETIGGGSVLDPASHRRRRMDPSTLGLLTEAAAGQPVRALLARLREAGARGASVVGLARALGVAPDRVRRRLVELGARPETGDTVVDAASWAALRDRALEAVSSHHRDHPLEHGIPFPHLVRKLPEGTASDAAAALLRDLVRRGELLQGAEGYRSPDFDPDRQGNAATRRIEAMFRDAGLTPPDETEIVRHEAAGRDLLAYLVRTTALVRTVDRVQKRTILFHREALGMARQRLRERFASDRGFSAGEAGAALGISRKFSIPLLEYLDATGFTTRAGALRFIAVSATSSTVPEGAEAQRKR